MAWAEPSALAQWAARLCATALGVPLLPEVRIRLLCCRISSPQ